MAAEEEAALGGRTGAPVAAEGPLPGRAPGGAEEEEEEEEAGGMGGPLDRAVPPATGGT